MIIRPFEPADQDAARRLILDGLGEHFGFIDQTRNPDLDGIARHYLAAGHAFLVAEADGQVVGTGGLIAYGANTGRIVRMSVSRDLRRLGIGRAVVTRLLDLARERGYSRVVVAIECPCVWVRNRIGRQPSVSTRRSGSPNTIEMMKTSTSR